MLRRIIGNITKSFRQTASTDIPPSPIEASASSSSSFVSIFEDDPKIAAKRKLTKAMQELSQSQRIPSSSSSHRMISPDLTKNLISKDLADLSVDELNSLARVYYSGQQTDIVAKNITKAVELWKISKDKGSIEGKFSYAQCLKDGNGVEQDVVQAFQLMKDLSDRDNYNFSHVSIFELRITFLVTDCTSIVFCRDNV
jgi:TPR repeat protein